MVTYVTLAGVGKPGPRLRRTRGRSRPDYLSAQYAAVPTIGHSRSGSAR
jgi:hypothetical protein